MQSQFQSLGRDSVRSDLAHLDMADLLILFQSLGRDSVRSDETEKENRVNE